jgi:hypothetical protein
MKKLLLALCFVLVTSEAFANIGWFVCPYKRRVEAERPTRYCAMDDYTQQVIYTDGGNWAETEILGDRCIVKVKAEETTLQAIKDDGVCRRIPKDRLDDSLSDLPLAVKNAIKNEILDAGYTLQELQDRFGSDLGSYTLKDVLKFMASRRLKPRYDSATDTIVCDGEVQPVRSIDSVDQAFDPTEVPTR